MTASVQNARIVFAGTPEFAAQHLHALLQAGIRPIAVYTQPDRPAGRGQQLQKSAVKLLAEQHGLAVQQPLSLRDESAQNVLCDYAPDLMIVVAYGLILPIAVLNIPRLGCVNVHGSLLPRWRGAAPIQRAIEHGDAETGVGLMQMEAGLDTGPVYAEMRTAISVTDNASRLHDRLAQLGAEMLVRELPALLRGELRAQAQGEDGICYAHKLDKKEALINWSQSAEIIARKIRAFDPFPIAQTTQQGEVIKLFDAHIVNATDHDDLPGKILSQENDALVIRCGAGAIAVREMQLAGGKRLPVSELLKSRRERFAPGHRLGTP